MTTVQEFICIFCKEQFDDKEALQIHFRKHGDPQFNQSKIKTRPLWHKTEAQTSGEQSKDGPEMVGCDVCPEVFPTISKAITHKHKVHPDHEAKYFCPWCGKLFTMKHLYNKHMQASHQNNEESDERPFHCDCCEVDFFVPMAMLYHNKFFHRQDTDIPPFGHSKKLKMHNQEVLQVYYCSFCGEEYVNKVNLHKHTNDDHSDENQSPDEVLRCPLCDAIFYHLDAYEVHLTFHSVEDLYSEKNELMNDITEFSLEAVPPSTEKVENCEPQQDAETTMAEMNFEDILQMAADHSSEKLLKKSKKHKKHKKSKKSAITLDEFLNMNKDVFGEGLDFQGVEEVPTRAITKRLKVNKKAQIPSSKTTPELDKLRRQGIIIKKKSDGEIMTKPLKIAQNVLNNKSKGNNIKEGMKLTSSSEVLSKLLNQGNNEIQIIKKSNQENNINLCEVIFKEESRELPPALFDDENMECDSTKKELGETAVESKILKEMEENLHKSTSLDNSDFSEKNTSQDSQDTSNFKSEFPSPSDNSIKDTKLNDLINDRNFSTDKNNTKSIVSLNLSKPEKVLESKDDLRKMTQNTVKINASNLETNSNIHDESELDTNVTGFYEETELPTKLEKDTSNTTNESLSALKHLSHLITVKPISQAKYVIQDNSVGENKNIYKKNLEAVGKTTIETSVTSTESYKDVNDVAPMTESALGTLKNLGKNIIFKSVSRKMSDVETKSTDINDSYNDDDDNINPLSDTNNSQHSNRELCGTTTKSINVNVDTNTVPLKRPSPTTVTNYTEDLPFHKEIINNDKDFNNTSSHLLKHLTSITAKPLSITRGVNKVTPLYSSPSRNIVNKNIGRTVQNIVTNQDDIEILNIDDSDSDDMDNLNQKTLIKPKHPPMLESCKNVAKEISHSQTQITETSNYVNQNKAVSSSSHTTMVNQKTTNEKNVAIKNVLKALGKNITIKSRNSSPIHIVKNQERHSENSDIAHNDCDSDTDCSGKVKITEISEEYASDEDIKQNQSNQNAIIQMPDDSCSGNEAETQVNEDTDDQESDFEANIKINTLHKPDPTIQSIKNSSFNNFQNISKDITIKSVNDNNNREQISKSVPISENSQNSSHTSLKQIKQNKIDQQENNSNIGLVVGQKPCMNIANQKTASSSNQVNKEVTVKTFQTQTKTVIQEITTTVTKTIKTVNQMVKEESSNSFQSTPLPVVPQKIQGVRVNQKPKNFQGVTVRHATSPSMRPQIRNPTPIRPGGSNIIRASNKLVPTSGPRLPNQITRPGINVTRLNTPRTSSQQKIRPTMGNIQTTSVGKHLKISPNAVVSLANKRPNSEEPAGPFSCFKKSKESLIPGSEIPTFSNSGDMKMEYTSNMQMSKSNYMSTMKTVKGNSVVTSTQMKSEMSASSQQFSKITNTSGMRVVKTSQNKQVQETSENSGMKQTTLDAIEKLQKQGLLIKKPRLEHSEDSEHSDADGDDDNMDYNAIDENND